MTCDDVDRAVRYLVESREADAFDVAEAIHAFANDYHGGQWTDLYRVLSASKFRPGPMWRGPESEAAQEIYAALAEFDAMDPHGAGEIAERLQIWADHQS